VSDFIPMTVYYEQQVSCSLCVNTTTKGIREYDKNRKATECPLCTDCMHSLLQEYLHRFTHPHQQATTESHG
jgi:hypothetical protein